MSIKMIDLINEAFLKGEVPKELNYSVQPVEEIDWNMVRYNSFYKSYEFAESKFPSGHRLIPGFEKVIEACIPKLTPLQEIEMIQKNILDQ